MTTAAGTPAVIPPNSLATARSVMNPGGMAPLGTTEIRARDLVAGAPPLAGTTATAYQVQNPPGAAGRGAANALSTPQGREAAYQAWLKDRNLPANNNTRTRFNIEYGLPKNLFNRANTPPGTGAPGDVATPAQEQSAYDQEFWAGKRPDISDPAYDQWYERATKGQPSYGGGGGVGSATDPPTYRDRIIPPGLRNQAEGGQSVVPKTLTPRERIRQGFGETRKAQRGGAEAKGDRFDRQTRRDILRDRYLMKSDENARAQKQRYENRRKGRDPGPPLPAPEEIMRRNRMREPGSWQYPTG